MFLCTVQVWCQDAPAGEEDRDWVIRTAPGKGLGVFALREFIRGERIMVEAPLDVPTPGMTEPQQRRSEAWTLLEPPGEIQAKVDLNGLGSGPDDEAPAKMVCARISRCNHACAANAYHWFEPSTKTKLLVARRPIGKGEEVCIDYMGDDKEHWEPKFRSVMLLMKWRIKCPADCVCKREEVRMLHQRMCEMTDDILRLGSSGREALAERKAVMLLKMQEDAQEAHVAIARTFYDAFQVTVVRRATMGKAKKYIQSAYDIHLEVLGPHAVETKKMKGFLDHPSSHHNYLACEY